MADLRKALRRHRAAELTIEPLIDAVAEFGTVVGEAVGKDYRIDNPRAVKFLKGYMAERVGMINETTREALHRAIASDDPRSAVREVFRQARESRAEAIAESEVVRASNFGAVDAGKWVKVLDRKRWATRQDVKVREEHRALHGQTVEWNGKFKSPGGHTGPGPGSMSGGAAMNARCFPGETPVSFCEIKKVFRRWYTGKLVTLTFDDGRTLRVTPNHPLLGVEGWTTAGRVEDGADLVHESFLDHRLHLGEPQPDDVPLPIEEVFRLAAMAGEVRRMPCVAPDFHGDGREGHVDIVTLDGEFWGGDQSPLAELVKEITDSGAHAVQGSLSTLRLLAGVFDFEWLAAHGGMGSFGQAFALDAVGAGHAVEHGRGTVARDDPGFEQMASNDVALQAEPNRDRLFRHLGIETDDLVDRFRAEVDAVSDRRDAGLFESAIDGLSADAQALADFVRAEPAAVQPGNLVRVHRKSSHHWSGLVYNLETVYGYYSAATVLASNCRCAAVPVAPEAVEEFDRDPVELFDALRRPIEGRLKRAWIKVFDEQEAAVLAELD